MGQLDIFQELYPTFKFNKKNIRLVELFSGIGSQAKALKQLSKELDFELETVAISEIDKYAIKSYNAIHGDTYNLGDISKVSEHDFPSDIDIMSWSSPCQDFSLAGKLLGFEGNKGSLTHITLDLLSRLKKIKRLPKLLLFENVKNYEVPVLGNAFGSMKRLEIGLETSDFTEIGKRIVDLTKMDIPSGLFNKLKKLPLK